MKSIQVYDRPLCCSTGICGPQVDPVLPRFAADLEWLREQGFIVDRFNLAQQPQAFVDNESVRTLLAEQGVEVLPVVVADGEIVSKSEYPNRQILASWAGIPLAEKKAKSLPVLGTASDGCCDSGCC